MDKRFRNLYGAVNHDLPLIHFSHFLEQTLTGGSLFLLAHDAGLFKMLTLFHFRENTGLFDLFLETAQRDIEAVVVVVKIYSGQKNHLPYVCIASEANGLASVRFPNNRLKERKFTKIF
ncbi:MAG: hypothetical protein DELT_02189 [Desulfovibrio sp.]